jgi:ATP-dependent RNA helicase UAP56/SUB2
VGVPKLRADVQDIFLKTPHQKQVMMFTATLSEGLKVDCKKFLQNEVDIFVDEGKLTLHKLEQFFTLIS